MLRLFAFVVLTVVAATTWAAEFSITMDDPHTGKTALFDWKEKNKRILSALKAHSTKAALFVCGMRVDKTDGKTLLENWDREGHLIGNHSYSHLFFHSEKVSLNEYLADISKGERVISGFKNF